MHNVVLNVLLVLGVLLAPFAVSAPAPLASPEPLVPLALFLLGHRIGTESGTIARDSAGSTLTTRFEFLDRASQITLETTLELRSDLTPTRFESHGRTYRLFPVDVSVPRASGAANTLTT